MKSRNIYIVRHGKLQIDNRQKWFIGQIDLPLSREGIKQAYDLKIRLRREEIEAAYCSDLSRSMETARIIVGGRNIPINIRKDLREISLGEWDGYSHEEIEQRYPDEYRKRGEDIWNYRIPGGETFADSSDRVIPAFKEILAATSGNVLIAGHAGVNRLIICHVTGKPVRDLFQIEQEYGCLYIIKCSDSGFQLDREGTDFFFAVIVELSSSSLPV